CMQGKEFPLTF
nr:immunoglobulin light chain junction region [Macaca mulatta]MOW61712.1 immunoglobulin light chain junction region [Macaca mulatta]MOW61767.1 immunoglobulin light chain junction region [Macaca mulatta]MOW61795.1 immunoglobulin light chain junction region [Macaca mulatta]MOW61805.1 immunoglobulin light chain junction region [Macaca mulatta]